jgi:TPR repeat protein
MKYLILKMDRIALFDRFIANDHSYKTYSQLKRGLQYTKIYFDYLKSLDTTNSNVQVLLGLLYCSGFDYNMHDDDSESTKWFLLSAEQNNSYGQYNMSGQYVYGFGIKKDLAKGIELCTLSAKQNNPYALDYLSRLFEDNLINISKMEGEKLTSFDLNYNYL